MAPRRNRLVPRRRSSCSSTTAPVAVDDDPDPSPSATPDPSNYVVYEDPTPDVSALYGVLSNDYDPNVPDHRTRSRRL